MRCGTSARGGPFQTLANGVGEAIFEGEMVRELGLSIKVSPWFGG